MVIAGLLPLGSGLCCSLSAARIGFWQMRIIIPHGHENLHNMLQIIICLVQPSASEKGMWPNYGLSPVLLSAPPSQHDVMCCYVLMLEQVGFGCQVVNSCLPCRAHAMDVSGMRHKACPCPMRLAGRVQQVVPVAHPPWAVRVSCSPTPPGQPEGPPPLSN